MVERGVNRLPGRLDVGKVEYPAECGINLPADGELNLKRMDVKARKRVGCRQGGQTARALQVKYSKDVHAPFSRKSLMLAMQ